ncbi:MAG TPA: hypothetical protein VNH82_09100 [Candidatus Dormibacteraeota bacterium]|nr:hypothetical protein [Candidatus Dormibacteraeota bacterium]
MSAVCETQRGSLAMVAIGRANLWIRLRLRAHLATCASCREELVQLRVVTRAIASADPGRVVLAPLPQAPRHADRAFAPTMPTGDGLLRRSRWALGSLAVTVAVVGAALVWLNVAGSSGAIPLQGSQGVHASATISGEAWGTDLSLQVQGQPAGHVYHVEMESTTGTWWQAGSYESESGQVDVHLACGVAPSKVDRIWVENASGQVVLSAEV